MPPVLTFDVAAFRVQFPEFSDDTIYPDALLQGYWDRATCYISAVNYGYLNGDCRQNALNLMVAHLATLATAAAGGQTNAMMPQSATIDKITVALTPPPLPNQFQWWLGNTIYGAQLLALLQSAAVGGFSAGSLPETAAFRRVGGIFI
jgi:uncharacterized protein DUF4054